ncbi:NADPH-dependent oxidoreductase [Falsirhodobacter halotolerans]|uniref:NADPH-dependent oxidoreductase n=1 Tax=Falsirhodobacter halotolerans TaxID=1146892 RepID=UPI001FD0400E|nr:NADPH-dependent oxidoreductase [Falsirhodobacter halotolerans]MCJ8139183.1 NADPH-dependent oxidoreductase [Falsirhodobacter halotolerans]
MSSPVTERYGAPVAPTAPLNEATRVILHHKSCRAYTAQPVPDDVLNLLIAAAQSAPSSSNLQCWSVVAVGDPARRAELSALCGHQRHIEQAPLMLCFLADLDRIGTVAARHDLPTDTLDYVEMSVVGVIDASLAAQNLVTAAEAHGLGTCYIGGLRNDIGAVRQALNLPDRIMPVFGLTLGYPDPAVPAAVKPRLAPAAVLHRDTFTPPDYTTLIDDYDATMARFNEGQGRDVDDWSLLSGKRVATVDRMAGRDRLLGLMRKMGMALK